MNTKKIIAGVSACILAFVAVPFNNTVSLAVEETTESTVENYSTGKYESLTYKKYADHIEISDCDTSVTDVVIPEKIENLPVTVVGGFSDCTEMKSLKLPDSVTEISEKAFLGCMSLESLTIPQSVKIIGQRAFWRCTSIKEIVIPEGVSAIGGHTFEWCESLKNISIPESVSAIGDYAFHWCFSLNSLKLPDKLVSIGENAFMNSAIKNISVPDSVSSIGTSAFSGCNLLENITVSENNKSYCSVDGVLMNKDKTIILNYPSAKSGKYVMPDSVKEIAYNSFYGCINLSEIEFSENLSKIGTQAFNNCEKLKSVSLPESLKILGNAAFANCSALENAVIPASVRSIGISTFNNCTNLKEVRIMNPYCEIYDAETTINNKYDKTDTDNYYHGKICGYDNSTAQSYAEKYGYTFESLGEAPPKPDNVKGDLSLDGVVDIADVVAAASYVGDPVTNSLGTQSLINGDVHNSGDGITASDVLMIQQYIAKIITEW